MFVQLKDSLGRKRYTVPCLNYAANYEDGLILLELAGVDTANRAIWSHIVKGRKERTLTATGATFYMGGVKETISIIPGVKYHKVEETGRLLLMHDNTTRFRYQYMFDGTDTDPSPWLLPVLQANLPLPILEHWVDPIWRNVVDDGKLIKPVEVYGPAKIWKFRQSEPEWANVITTFVKNGLLTPEPVH